MTSLGPCDDCGASMISFGLRALPVIFFIASSKRFMS
jgi:hypothetical protein